MNSVAIARKPSPARECRIALLCHDDAPRPNDKGLVIALKMTDLVEGRRCRFEARLRSRIVIALDWLEGVLKRIAYCFGLVLGLCIPRVMNAWLFPKSESILIDALNSSTHPEQKLTLLKFKADLVMFCDLSCAAEIDVIRNHKITANHLVFQALQKSS